MAADNALLVVLIRFQPTVRGSPEHFLDSVISFLTDNPSVQKVQSYGELKGNDDDPIIAVLCRAKSELELRVKDIIAGSKLSSEVLAQMCMGRYDLVQNYPQDFELLEAPHPCILWGGLDNHEDKLSNEELDEWYRKQHLDMFSMCDGYAGCNRFRRVQSDAAWGNSGEEIPTPRWVAIHAFATPTVKLEQAAKTVQTEWAARVMSNASSQLMMLGPKVVNKL